MANIRNIIDDAKVKYGKSVAFTIKLGKEEYDNVTFDRYYEEARAVGNVIIAEKMNGLKLAVCGKNSYPWFLANTANYISGSVTVPLDKELQYDEFENSLIIGEVDYLFYDKMTKANAQKAFESGKTCLKGIIYLEKDPELYNIYDMIEKGKALLAEGNTAIDHVEIDDYGMSLLLFTSGTTSSAKAVMLSQNAIVSNTRAACEVEDVRATDTNIALLPYHHIFGSTGQWVILNSGARTVYCDGLKYLQKNLQEYGVSIFIGVPLIVENMYKKVLHTAEKSGSLKKLMLLRKVSNALYKCGIDVRRKLFKMVLDAFGGKMRMCIVGAAPMSAECIQAFSDFGILTVQGYGLTETAPILAAERPTHLRPGSVGIPMKGVEIRIDEPNEKGIGEIIAKGENIMLGYRNNQEATDAVLYDGWFHTGDLGYFDKDGYLYITGRKKNVIVLKNGKNVFPEELEQVLSELPYVNEVVVVGIPKKDDPKDLVVTTKIVYKPESFENMSKEEITKAVWEDIYALNEKLPPYKAIKRLVVTDKEMVKTTTQKVKRFIETENIIKELDE